MWRFPEFSEKRSTGWKTRATCCVLIVTRAFEPVRSAHGLKGRVTLNWVGLRPDRYARVAGAVQVGLPPRVVVAAEVVRAAVFDFAGEVGADEIVVVESAVDLVGAGAAVEIVVAGFAA